MMTLFGQMPVDLMKSAAAWLGLWSAGTPGSAWLYGFVQYFLNSIWQATVIVILVAWALRLFGRANGATKHAIWCATLVAVLGVPLVASALARRTPVVPASTFAAVEESTLPLEEIVPFTPSEETHATRPPVRLTQAPVKVPAEGSRDGQSLDAESIRLPAGAERRSVVLPVPLPERFTDRIVALPAGPWMLTLFALWLGIALLRLVRLADGYGTVRLIRSNCRALPRELGLRLQAQLDACGVGEGARLAESELLSVPALVGFFEPTVVFPSPVVATLSLPELTCIALHELAHARRRDQWTNLLQRMVECLFFFNPAVMWVSRRLTLEREIACDDWVVAATGQPRPYAACLARLIECTQRPVCPLPVPGAVLTRQQFLRRVEILLNRRNHRSPRLSPVAAFTGALLLGFVVLQIALAGPLVTVSQAAPSQSKPPGPVSPPPALPATPEPAPAPTSVVQAPAPPSALPGTPTPPATPSTPAADAAPYPPSVPSVPKATQAPRSKSERRAQSASRAPRAERDALVETKASIRETQSAMAEAQASVREAQAGAAEAAREMSRLKKSMADLDDMHFDGSLSIHGDNGEVSYSWSDRGHKLRVEMEGEIKFAPDESDVAEISRDGYFRIEERKGSERHELEIVPGRSGELEYFYSQRGRPQPYDARAKAWLARALPDIMRRTGLNAAERTARLYRDGGADAVLAETADMESDYVRRMYYEELLKLDGGKGPTVRTILRQMVGHTDSDYETAELLIAMAPFATNDPEARDAYLKTALGIDSDYETRRVLSAIGSLKDLKPDQARAMLEVADRMDSDYEKAELLIEIADLCRAQSGLRRDYLAVLRGIDSDYEKRRTLDALGDIGGADDAFVAGVLATAGTIDSDYERAELLTGMADQATRSDALLEAYLQAAEEIGSDYEKRRAISALTLGDNAGENALLDLLRIAEGIDSDYEKAEFLLEYGKHYLGSSRLENALHDAIETIGSDYERERVEAALWRHERDSRRSGRAR